MVAGLGVGAIISMILIFVVNRQSFHWTMDVHVPWLLLASLSVILIVASAGTAACQRPARDGRRRGARGQGRLVKESSNQETSADDRSCHETRAKDRSR